MIIHLTPALAGKTDTVHVKVPLESDRMPSGRFHGAGMHYRLAKDSEDMIDFVFAYEEGNKVMIKANACIICKTACSKCLRPMEFPLDLEIVREVDFNLSEAQRREAMDEMNFIHEFDLDTEILLREEIMLALPMQIVCREDCKGLCGICGINRNEGTCSCDNLPKDPRMAVFAELFKQQSIPEDSK